MENTDTHHHKEETLTSPPATEPQELAPQKLVDDAAQTTDQKQLLTEDIEKILAEVRNFNERAQSYETNARKMHSMIEHLQQDQVRSLLKPVFVRLATLHAEANEIAAQKKEEDPTGSDDFEYFATCIEEIFALFDIDSVCAAVGNKFDAKKHQADRSIKTDDPSLDKTITRVIRQGFAFAGAERTLLPARVSIKKYVQADDSA